MKQFSTILFDLDGTLIDSTIDIAAGVNHVRECADLSAYSIADIRQLVGNGLHRLIYDALPEELRQHPHRREELVQIFSTYYDQHLLDHTTLYDGMYEVLQQLNGASLGVVTNKPLHWSKRILNGLAIDNNFQFVIGGDSHLQKKPAPDTILEAIRTLKADPKFTLMVGDSCQDIEAAQSAGVAVCWVSWGFGSQDLHQKYSPDFVVHQPAELIKLCSR